ncbi:MAG: hypothetical protein NC131_06150 [Roseburia sp.]|nr:hypothetical protein [Roseburia sp.]
MYMFLWRIRRVDHKLYQITLDPKSFGYESFPESDRQWKNDNVEELINEAKAVVNTNLLGCDHYGKIWEYSDLVFDMDEEVVNEIRMEGQDEASHSKGCLFLIMAVLIIVLAAYTFF